MKTLIALLLTLSTVSAFAFQAGNDGNVSYTKTIFGVHISSEGTHISTLGKQELKKVAIAIENDSQIYFQTGEMSAFLSNNIEEIRKENTDLSIDDAVSILLEFAQIQNK